jgi:hypothetical protein
MEVKGTWVVDYVKMIRANPDKNWAKYLTAEDQAIIDGKVLSSVWYPYEFFNRTGNAVFHEIAQENLEVTRAFGKMFAEGLATIYKNIIVPGDPAGSIGKVYALQGSFFRDIPSVIAPVLHESKRSVVRISVTAKEQALGAPKAFAYQFLGMLEQILAKSGAKQHQSTVKEIPNGFELDLRWE